MGKVGDPVQKCPKKKEAPPPDKPKVGVCLTFHPIQFGKLESPESEDKFKIIDEPEYPTPHLLADGLSKGVVMVYLAALDKGGKVAGKDITLASANEHFNEGKIVIELADDKHGQLEFKKEKGKKIEIPIKDLEGGKTKLDKEPSNAIIFTLTKEVGEVELKVSIDGASKYEFVKSFTIPKSSKKATTLKLGSRKIAKGTNGYDGLKLQWILKNFGFISYKFKKVSEKGNESEWHDSKDILLDGDCGDRTIQCLEDFQYVSLGPYRDAGNPSIPVTFKGKVGKEVTAEVIAELLVWSANGYGVKPFHGSAEIKDDSGGTSIDVKCRVLYGTLLQDDKPRGYVDVAKPVGGTVAHYDKSTIIIGDSIHSSIKIFEKDSLVFRLHDADPDKLLDDANLLGTFKTNVETTLKTTRKQQAADYTGADNRDIRVSSSYRGATEQNSLYAKGRTAAGEPCVHAGVAKPVGTCTVHPYGSKVTNAQAGYSWHNYGLAVDIVFCDANGNKSWGKDPTETGGPKWNWSQLGANGKAAGLTWGGDWSDPDQPHFQPAIASSPQQATIDAYQNATGSETDKIKAAWKQLNLT